MWVTEINGKFSEDEVMSVQSRYSTWDMGREGNLFPGHIVEG
jgi:hypothetical protein